jgi:hypothetical protein
LQSLVLSGIKSVTQVGMMGTNKLKLLRGKM